MVEEYDTNGFGMGCSFLTCCFSRQKKEDRVLGDVCCIYAPQSLRWFASGSNQ